MPPDPGIEPGTHWWKASALTTAPTLLPYMYAPQYVHSLSLLQNLLLSMTMNQSTESSDQADCFYEEPMWLQKGVFAFFLLRNDKRFPKTALALQLRDISTAHHDISIFFIVIICAPDHSEGLSLQWSIASRALCP